MSRPSYFYSILVLVSVLTHLITVIKAQQIFSCDGYLKSDVVIDFSKVDVKLYTKQGTLKESSDCAPKNGYFIIPLYDRGDYVLKIEPPVGWYFEPKEVNLNFDGVNDPCTQATGLTFTFKGFTVSGRVLSAGTDSGPEQVKVKLSEVTTSKSKLTHTVKNGYYQFTPVLPGNYTITAKHDKYKVTQDMLQIQVTNDNVVSNNNFIVPGYNIQGSVLSNGEPIKGVSLVIYCKDQKKLKIENCSTKEIPDLKHKKFICHVVSDDKGQFVFETVPPGVYIIRPHYPKFDVQPEQVDVAVQHGALVLDNQFQVKGFSVSGVVKSSPTGAGMSSARILLNQEHITTTNQHGRYSLDSLQPGTYELTVKADNVKFPVKMVKLSPNTPEIDDIYPSEWRVCGKVTPSSSTTVRLVQIDRVNGDSIEVAADRETGEYCYYLPPGKYQVSAKISEYEKTKGLQYLPLVRDVEVQESTVNNLDFSQLKAKITGKITKLSKRESNNDILVKLKQKNVVVASMKLDKDEDTFVLNEVMPGLYDVEVVSSEWCFEKDLYQVNVNSVQITLPSFVHNGYKARIISSHDTEVSIDKKQQVKLEKGENTVCVPRFGNIEVVPSGCHGYLQDSYTLKVSSGVALKLMAVSHDITWRVVSRQRVDDLIMEVLHPEVVKVRIGTGDIERAGKDNVYWFSYKSKENTRLVLRPTSGQLLFTPEQYEFETLNDCMTNVVEFYGEQGLIVEGKVEPPLAGVTVTLKHGQNLLKYDTQDDGTYKFGPLKHNVKYELTAEKESYKMFGPDAANNFKAHKLAEISVKVTDVEHKTLLHGVLLSLTGVSKYRNNSVTERGARTFNSLTPGEYYLRPMMKEYKFEPNSMIIQVKEGVTESVHFKGRRVAYSVYGTISSLSDEPDSNVVIEAIGINTCSNLQEEGVTERNGSFRIRGLLPQCEYDLRLKQGTDVNTHVQRIAPASVTIKTNAEDKHGIKFTSFQPVMHSDVTVLVKSEVPEHLKSVKLKVYKDDRPDSPIYTVKLDSVAGGSKRWGGQYSQERFLKPGIYLTLPRISRDDGQYYVTLESTLNKHNYEYTEPVSYFTISNTYHHVNILFSARARSIDTDLASTNYFIAPLLVLGALLYLYSDKIVPYTRLLVDYINHVPVQHEEQVGESLLMDQAQHSGLVKRKNKSRKT